MNAVDADVVDGGTSVAASVADADTASLIPSAGTVYPVTGLKYLSELGIVPLTETVLAHALAPALAPIHGVASVFAGLPRVIAEGRYAAIDIETTGLSTKVDEAVQIAVALIDHGRPGLRGYYTLRPYHAIAPGAEAKHGLTYEKLMYSPDFKDIACELQTIIGDRIVLGFNTKRFDVPILTRQFAETSLVFAPRVLDVLLWSRKLMPGRCALGDMAARLEITFDNRHDAWHDIRATWSVFGQLALRFPAFGASSPEDVIEP